jgi:hypothetical protein
MEPGTHGLRAVMARLESQKKKEEAMDASSFDFLGN